MSKPETFGRMRMLLRGPQTVKLEVCTTFTNDYSLPDALRLKAERATLVDASGRIINADLFLARILSEMPSPTPGKDERVSMVFMDFMMNRTRDLSPTRAFTIMTTQGWFDEDEIRFAFDLACATAEFLGARVPSDKTYIQALQRYAARITDVAVPAEHCPKKTVQLHLTKRTLTVSEQDVNGQYHWTQREAWFDQNDKLVRTGDVIGAPRWGPVSIITEGLEAALLDTTEGQEAIAVDENGIPLGNRASRRYRNVNG